MAHQHPAPRVWDVLMQRLAQGLAARGAHPARTVVLLPYAQLMPVARGAWAALRPSGFAPRFETTMNWAGQSPFVPGPVDLAFDMGRDLLVARGWLEQGGLGRQADALASRLVEAAWEAAAAARARPPDQRAAWAADVRPALLQGMEAPALALEAAVARIAFEWAAASGYASDALLDGTLTRGMDWLVVLRGFQTDAVAETLLLQLGERAEAWAWPQEAPIGQLALHACGDAADESERAAAAVLRHLQAGRSPVALAATDRVLTRRVGALLATRGVPVRDETGWKLSTTRAAAQAMGALRACAWDASSDAVIDWLKHAPALAPGVVQGLERRARRAAQRQWRLLRQQDWGDAPVLAAAAAQVAQWRDGLQAARPLPRWLDSLRALLRDTGAWTALDADAAGREVMEVLRLAEGAAAELAELDRGRTLEAHDFRRWANEVLEAASYVPASAGDEPVVVLPLSQLLGHAFAALVLPGCDERSLPAAPEPPAAWTAAQRRLLGLPGPDPLAQAQRLAWRQALATPCSDVLWRASDDSGERVLPSPLVQELQLAALGAAGADPRDLRRLTAEVVAAPLPRAAALVPVELSASSYEDLRRCPYRFFALRMLGLRDADELETEVDKRDFGTWLHALLRHFHEELALRADLSAEARLALLDQLAGDGLAALRLGEGEFLPFAAGWPAVRDGYLQWLARHEAGGARFEQAESAQEVPFGVHRLIGHIDRIDRVPEGRALVIDYKTEAFQATRDRVAQPLEDTQLAFYAALLPDESVQAAYLNISERGEVRLVEHPDVEQTRHFLGAGLWDDLQRLAAGAALPALGEGRVCDHCAARGLCRRDAWQ